MTYETVYSSSSSSVSVLHFIGSMVWSCGFEISIHLCCDVFSTCIHYLPLSIFSGRHHRTFSLSMTDPDLCVSQVLPCSRLGRPSVSADHSVANGACFGTSKADGCTVSSAGVVESCSFTCSGLSSSKRRKLTRATVLLTAMRL